MIERREGHNWLERVFQRSASFVALAALGRGCRRDRGVGGRGAIGRGRVLGCHHRTAARAAHDLGRPLAPEA